MNIIVLPQAADEFEDAVAHYADKQPGLGQRFRDEVDRHIRWIAAAGAKPFLRPSLNTPRLRPEKSLLRY
jgi:hypothetical protein